MSEKKWYLFEQLAEGDAYLIVEMSDEEFEVMCNVSERMECFYCESYCGSFGQMPYEPFNSKEEAIMAVLKDEYINVNDLDQKYHDMYEKAEKEKEEEFKRQLEIDRREHPEWFDDESNEESP